MKKLVIVPFFTVALILLSKEASATITNAVGWLTKREFDFVLWILALILFVNILIIIVLMIRCPRDRE